MTIAASYEIATIMLSTVIFIFYNRTRKIAVFQDDVLLLLLVMNTLTAACDLLRRILVYYWWTGSVAKETLDACSMGYFATHIIVVPLMCLYVFAITKSWKEASFLFKASFLIPLALAYAFIFTNPFTNFIFSHTENGVYQRADGIIMIYAIACYYLFYLLILVFYYRKNYSFTKQVTILTVVLLCVLGTAIQFFFPEQVIETVSISLGALILLLFIQNPASQVDRATGAFSKTVFCSIMNHNCLAKKKKELFFVILDNVNDENCEIDDTKMDGALLQIVRFLQELAPRFSVYRVEKYIFCIETPILSEKQSDKLVEDIRNRFRNAWGYLECNLYLYAKIAKIVLPEDIHSLDQLLGVLDRMAVADYTDEVMRVSAYDLDKIEREKRITDALAKSMENRDFEMRYTPIFSMKENRIAGAEVTIRFYEDSLGYVYDDEILNFAERAGHMTNLGERIFEQTCNLMHKENLQELGIGRIYVQILPTMCMQPNLSDKLLEIMEKYSIDPSVICLQLSELAVAKATDIFRINMEELACKGVHFCLTGYGSGYTNISSIYDLPFCMIKFSSSFVQSALNNAKAQITVDCMLTLSKDLEMETCLTGIDNKDYYEMIVGMSCDYAEGNYFYEQLDLVGFRKVIEDSHAEQEPDGEEDGNAV